jgi:hypothetical protein
MKELLDAAIPQEEFHALEARVSAARGRRDSYMEHSGYWRGGDSKTGRIASFNNTRPTEREVAAWFEDARELLEQTPTA